jgi:hypothetical protein
VIQAQFKVKGVVLCDISYGTEKKLKYVVTVILPIRSSVWLKILLEDLYVELICFIIINWKKRSSQMKNVPLLKYMTSYDITDLAIVSNVADRIRIYLLS